MAAENRIFKAQIKGRLLLSDGEKATLAEIAYRLGRKALREVAMVAQPETILAWYRRLIANKFDGSKSRRSPGAPRVGADIESLVVCMAKEHLDVMAATARLVARWNKGTAAGSSFLSNAWEPRL